MLLILTLRQFCKFRKGKETAKGDMLLKNDVFWLLDAQEFIYFIHL